jgi:hypothetical protein
MKKLPGIHFVLWLLLMMAGSAFAQGSGSPVQGRFYIQIDDDMSLYLNGKMIHHGDYGVSETRQVALSPGDRLVVDVENKGGPYGLKMIFVSRDRKTIINFGVDSFRLLHDPDKKDFTAREYEGWKEPAHQGYKMFHSHLTFKNTAQWVWGEKRSGISYLACLITKGMFDRLEE